MREKHQRKNIPSLCRRPETTRTVDARILRHNPAVAFSDERISKRSRVKFDYTQVDLCTARRRERKLELSSQ
jgi:hypothetical protein